MKDYFNLIQISGISHDMANLDLFLIQYPEIVKFTISVHSFRLHLVFIPYPQTQGGL
jgi:hypothetical protein